MFVALAAAAESFIAAHSPCAGACEVRRSDEPGKLLKKNAEVSQTCGVSLQLAVLSKVPSLSETPRQLQAAA